MNFRTTYILFGLLFAFLGVMLLTQLTGTRGGDQPEYALPSLHDVLKPTKSDDFDTVEIQRFHPTAETLRFYKDSKGGWHCKDPDVRLVAGLARQVIDQVMNPFSPLNELGRPRSIGEEFSTRSAYLTNRFLA